MELTECGPAALAIILAYFGRRVPLEELRVACGVSRDGSKAVQHRARRAPLRPDAKGYRLELDEVLAGPFPVIVHLGLQPFPGGRGRLGYQVLLNDPATGPRTRQPRGVQREASPASCCASRPARLQPGGASVGAAGPARPPPVGLRTGDRHRRLAQPDAGDPGAGPAGGDQGLRRRHPGQALRRLAEPAAGRARRHVRAADRAVGRCRRWRCCASSSSSRWSSRRASPGMCFACRSSSSTSASPATSPTASRPTTAWRRLLARDCGHAAATCFTASFLGIVMLFYDPILAAIAIGGAALNIGVLTPGASRAAGRRAAPADRDAASCSPSRSSACSPSRR